MSDEINDALDDVARLMRQRNSMVFAIQCFAYRAEGGLKEDMHVYLSAAGFEILPDHDLIAPSAAGVTESDQP